MALIIAIALLTLMGLAFPPFWLVALGLVILGLVRPALWRKPLGRGSNPNLKGWNDK